ncbi:copper chaperone PCu(A)C [Microbulbifer sp. SH-1]|uniref:copper chaperone PCu(A)C n=1 Tax=Microbulbifer sp. SH-1 TaxID=2681547 RepID=UPI00140CE89F|nr:copper chaperone PCu(A)C [Microbulbifer sp. SH-1]QIL90283.1 copper chaperone PCu(A)C [Microbulbifer sp. SH-1]
MSRISVDQKTAVLKKMCTLLLCSLLAGVGVAAAETGQAGEIEASGYAREMPPGAPMGAAYLSLRELSGRARVLRRVELPAHSQASVELHTTEEVAGVSRMRALKEIPLPGHGAIEMRPGATHLMIRGVVLRAGQSLTLRLVFADGSAREVTLPVQGLAQADKSPAANGKEEERHRGHHHG